MSDFLEVVARAERAERRLAELQKVFRDTDRDVVHAHMRHITDQMREMRRLHRLHRSWLRRLRMSDRVYYAMLGALALWNCEVLYWLVTK